MPWIAVVVLHSSSCGLNESVSLFLGGSFIVELETSEIQWSLRVCSIMDTKVERRSQSSFAALSLVEEEKYTSGEIVNHMAVDIQRVLDFLYMHDIWILLLQVALALLILYQKVGVAAIANVVATLASVAINTPFTSLRDKYKDKIMEAKDARLRPTTECLKSMRILKVQAWEKAYLQKLEALRWLVEETVLDAGSYNFPLLDKSQWSLLEALTALPDCISTLSRTRVSLNRLSKFLHEPELQADAVSRTNDQDPTVILVEAADISEWMSRRDDSFGLRNGWFRSRSKYYRVLEMCQLKRDLEILPFGDQTEIGERGVNLSGGQKQRMQLVRALYQDGDIYLLHDPFDAVDVETGTQIFRFTGTTARQFTRAYIGEYAAVSNLSNCVRLVNGSATAVSPQFDPIRLIIGYGGFFAWSIAGVTSATSQKVFFDILHCIFHLRMWFFYSTPTGLGALRSQEYSFSTLWELCLKQFGVLIVFAPVSVFCILLRVNLVFNQHLCPNEVVFICRDITYRQAGSFPGFKASRRIDHFAESIAGAPTVREEERFKHRINTSARVYLYSAAAMEWASMRLELHPQPFRPYSEPASGKSVIDRVDDLRSKLSIIPQDPALFDGIIC
ncbi:hypothetical protein SELMODRAFT_402337 [Selaginella moellendorffii]|uniref:ABC transmembrane type-1 domain-containing protein n=1 Tax=Selaginella moellendorffii TaxID=88036 RepID=D8QQB6_SELML|nr:hypothetical protein SELMODRAFT_402337 [Selaginella moellendorffii]